MMEIINKRNIVWEINVFITVLAAWAVGMVNAGDTLTILSIKPVPDVFSGEVLNSTQRRVSFHGGGVIDRIGRDDNGETIIVINDRLKYFARSVTYYSSGGEFLSFSRFQAGKKVGYFVNKKKEITDLYLLDH